MRGSEGAIHGERERPGARFWDDTGMTLNERWRQLETLLGELWRDTLNFPWRNTALTLRERFREDQLGVTASSLTFTTTISLVPLFTVALAIFSAFPMFARLQTTLQRWLVESLVPENIAKQVLSYLNQFAAKAGQMGWAGALVLLVTALALILTIDRKLNDIWRVRQPRPLTQRILVYWAVLTLGPLLLAASLTATSYAVSASSGMVSGGSGGAAPAARLAAVRADDRRHGRALPLRAQHPRALEPRAGGRPVRGRRHRAGQGAC